MLHDDAEAVTTRQNTRLNVFRILQAHDVASNQPCSGCPHQKTQCNIEVNETWAHNKHNQNCKKQEWEAGENLNDKGNNCINPTAIISGCNSRNKANKESNSLRNNTNRQRNLTAVNNTRKNISAVLIGAKQMCKRWILTLNYQVLSFVAIRSKDWSKDCNNRKGQNNA